MNPIIEYFSTIPSTHRGLILAGGIAFFWIIEIFNPAFRFSYNKWKHAGINIFFTLTTIVVNFILAFLLVKTSEWTYFNHFGILYWLPEMDFWIFALIGLMLMDFIGAYLVHYFEHKQKFFWRFHIVHHTDMQVDTTTANRHHPTESILRFLFTTLAVFLVGAPIWLIFLYQSLSVVFTQFNHSNINLPKKVDNILSYLIVTPDMHRVHHHYVLPFTDSNYGNIFSIWDRMFKTFKKLEREQIIFGVDTYFDDKKNNEISFLMRIPFLKTIFSDDLIKKS